jgi:hypothetical protein
VIAGRSRTIVEKFVAKLSLRLKVRDLQNAEWILGIEHKEWNNGKIASMSLTREIDKLVLVAGMQDARARTTPIENLNPAKEEENEDDQLLEKGELTFYQQLVGKLLYIEEHGRPDISYAVHRLTRAMHAPTGKDLRNAKHTVAYLKTTKEKVLIFRRPEKNLVLRSYCDIGFATELKGRSISAYFHEIEGAGLVSWKTKRQTLVTLSIMESELVGAIEALRETIHLQGVLEDLGYPQGASTLFMDNQSAITFSKNEKVNDRSKHINVRYFFIREAIESRIITVSYIESTNNKADVFTKPCSSALIEKVFENILVKRTSLVKGEKRNSTREVTQSNQRKIL